MPYGLKRFPQSAQSHFVTFTCYHRQQLLNSPAVYDLFLQVLERMRCRFALYIYGYVVMPEHVHLLVSEPLGELLADAIHYLKLSFAKRKGDGVFWQKRYYDRNVRSEREVGEKLRYIHRNPVKRGLVEKPEGWKWSSFRHYALREKGAVEIESEWTARDRERQTQGGAERIFLIPGERPTSGANLGHRPWRQSEKEMMESKNRQEIKRPVIPIPARLSTLWGDLVDNAEIVRPAVFGCAE